MKDGQTHLAHKAEHAVDMETGAVLAVTLQDANARRHHDNSANTDCCCRADGEKLTENDETAGQIAENWLAELVTDKGYHSNETMVDLKEFKIRSYISEPKRGRRNWTGARQQNAMPFMPIAGGFEASAAKAYYVVVDSCWNGHLLTAMKRDE